MLTQVDLHCLKTCLLAARHLSPGVRCHVNLFPSTLLDTPVERVIELFPHGPSLPRFCVELSEQQFIGDPTALRAPVRALKQAGLHVAVDDAGFGRGSIETLVLLEPDVIKVDPRYVQGVAGDRAKRRSLRRMVEAAGAIGGELVAEGIETRADLAVLRDLGIPLGQGFLWSRPD